jgi:hypothetical protein
MKLWEMRYCIMGRCPLAVLSDCTWHCFIIKRVKVTCSLCGFLLMFECERGSGCICTLAHPRPHSHTHAHTRTEDISQEMNLGGTQRLKRPCLPRFETLDRRSNLKMRENKNEKRSKGKTGYKHSSEVSAPGM